MGNPGNYIHLCPQEMAKVKEGLKTKRHAEVYRDADALHGPRNKQQIYNASSRLKKELLPA
jgi:hypothetical protein